LVFIFCLSFDVMFDLHYYIQWHFVSMFDSNVVYAGPPGKVGAFFARRGYDCPRGMNMADYVLDTISSPAYRAAEAAEAAEDSNEGRNEVGEVNSMLNAFPTLTESNHAGSGEGLMAPTPRRSSFEMQNNSGRSISSTFSASAGSSASSANGASPPVSWHACCCQKRYTPWELQHGENDGFCHGYVYLGSVPWICTATFDLTLFISCIMLLLLCGLRFAVCLRFAWLFACCCTQA
jgi:hypothetical protein